MYQGLCEFQFLSHSGRIRFDVSVAFLPQIAVIGYFVRASEGFFFLQARKPGHHLDGLDPLKALYVAIIFGQIADKIANDTDLVWPVEPEYFSFS